ncbi:putative tol protein, partial [Botrytis fragariae]
RNQLLNSNCRICRLVGSLVNPQSGSDVLNQSIELSDQPLVVRLDVCEDLSGIWGFGEACVKLAVKSPVAGSTKINGYYDYTRFIIAQKFRNNETVGIRILEPLRVNFDFLRQMLNKCLEDHGECQSTRVEVARLRVIDVTTETICQAPPDCEYIALSYVWGDKSACKSTQGEFPPVVQDAFIVTKALGYRYLWVDRYCIDQNPNSPHMQSMINQMDLVYGSAHATIVAASGNSASDGLAGISVPRYQGHAEIGEIHLIEFSDVEAAIVCSKWATRGWTYQEWYFSKRRLVFTDSEVMFLCNKKQAKETVLDPGSHPFENLGYEFKSMKPPNDTEAYSLQCYRLRSHISGYSKRNLSYDCDSLNAFAGILRYYESVAGGDDRPLSHLWGVPLQLLGYLKEGWVFFDLLWNHEAIAHRRDGLPSWSWSGWGGSVEFNTFLFHELEIRPHTVELEANKPLENSVHEEEGLTSAVKRVLRIQIPLEDRFVDLNSFCRERQLNLHHEIHPKELHITSFIIPLRFHEVDGYLRPQYFNEKNLRRPPIRIIPTFLARPGIFLGVPVCFDREYNFELHKLGLVLPSGGQFYKDPNTYNIIVLHPVADGKYERAGLAVLGYDVHTRNIENQGTYEYRVLLDENDNLISEEDPKYVNSRSEESNKYLFLQGAEWKTICLV